MVSFFDEMKDLEDITIVLFSEFWRTIKENWWSWTDHWKAWVMWILTSNIKLKSMLPQKIYWKLDITKEKENLLWVWIYYDSVYSKIIEALYNKTGIYTHTLEKDIKKVIPKISNFNTSLRASWSKYYTNITFGIESDNFSIKSAWNISIKYWNNINKLSKKINSRELYRSPKSILKDNKINFSKSISWTGFFYEISVMNNQYTEKTFTWIVDLVPYKTLINEISDNKDTVLSLFSNKMISWEEILSNKIFLGQTTWTWELEKVLTKWNGIILRLWTWSTYINKLTWEGKWYGRFVLWEYLPIDLLFSSWSKTNLWEKMKELPIEKVFKIWADTIWVWLWINRNVQIDLNNLSINKKYKILFSKNLEDWEYMTWTTTSLTWTLSFTTNHFTFFAIMQDVENDTIPDNFSFINLLNKELNTNYESNQIIVSWINTSIPISILWWEYSINSSNFTSSTWTVVLWDIIKIKLNSAPSYLTKVTSRLKLSQVSSDFSITTKTQINSSSSSGWWGWGGWWSSRSRDDCPNGDYSKSYYDRICWNIPDENKKEEDNKIKKSLSAEVLKKWESYFLYEWYNILQIKWFTFSDKIKKLAEKLISFDNIINNDKKDSIKIINNLLKTYYLYKESKTLDSKLKKDFKKQYKLLKSKLIEIFSKNKIYSNEKQKTKKYSYNILQIKWFNLNDEVFKIWKEIINNKNIWIKDKEKIILRLNEYIKAYYKLKQSKDRPKILKNKLKKQIILFQSIYKKSFGKLLILLEVKDKKIKKIITKNKKVLLYKRYSLFRIDNFSFSKKIEALSKKIINNTKISKENKEKLIFRLNKLLIARYDFLKKELTKKIKNNYIKQIILLKFLFKKIFK